MRLLPFFLRADRRQYIGGAIHAGVGFGGHIGPMRLDVGQTQAPWASVRFRFRDEIHRAARHVGRLGMLVRNAGGLVGVNEKPAVLQPAVFGRAGIGPVLPGILLVVSVLALLRIISRTSPVGGMRAIVYTASLNH